MSKTNEMFIAIQDELVNTREQVENGEMLNLDGLIKMREAKKQAEAILETVKNFEADRINEISNEASQYPNNKYNGFIITSVNGRETFNFKSIPQITELESTKKDLEDKFKSAFKGVVKGIVQTTEVDGIKYWIDENSELQLLPEFSIGKSFLMVKETKK